MEEAWAELVETLAGKRDKIHGVVVGKVVNVLDPMTLGRVQVQLPFLDSVDLSPWARVATPMAGPGTGFYFIPNVGDEVLVAFEHGDLKAPYILGGLWNSFSPPPLPSPAAQTRMIKTLSGNTILIAEVPPSITIQTATGHTIVMSPTGIQITAATSIVNLTPDGVTVTGTSINLTGTTAVNITAPTVTINGSAATNVQSGGVCSVNAPLVKIN